MVACWKARTLDEHLKKRLIGAAVLVSLAVIFVPMLIEKRSPVPGTQLSLPELPAEPPEPPVFEAQLLRDEVPAPVPLPPLVAAMDPPAISGPEETPETDPAAALPTPFEPPVNLQSWVIRVGTFRSRENAERLVAKLRAAGFDTLDPERVDSEGRVLYRVHVGPQIDRRRALSLLPKVKEVTRLDAKIRSYP
jgi:DedD protein